MGTHWVNGQKSREFGGTEGVDSFNAVPRNDSPATSAQHLVLRNILPGTNLPWANHIKPS